MEYCKKCGGEFTPLQIHKHQLGCNGVRMKTRGRRLSAGVTFPGGTPFSVIQNDWQAEYEDEVWRMENSESVSEIEEIMARREKRERRRLERLYGKRKPNLPNII